MGTVAVNNSCEFQEYWLRDSPLRGEKVAKISDFGEFLTRNLQIWADWGQIWGGGLADLCPPNRYSDSLLRVEKPKTVNLIPAVSAGKQLNLT